MLKTVQFVSIDSRCYYSACFTIDLGYIHLTCSKSLRIPVHREFMQYHISVGKYIGGLRGAGASQHLYI